MKSKQYIHQAMLNEWADRIRDQKASGLSVKQWCIENDISIHKYNYWKHQLKEEFVQASLPEIVPLAPAGTVSDAVPIARPIVTSSVKLNLGGISIEASPNVSDERLFAIIKAVRHA